MPEAQGLIDVSAVPVPFDSPADWRASTPLLDLEDPRLRLKVQSLTQLCSGEREKVLAVYGFVKRIPFAKPFKMRLHTAREVMDQGCGDAADKATLLVAMLRTAGLPARMRFVTLHGDVLRGLAPRTMVPTRPIVEAWFAGRWLATDSYLYDAAYGAAARQRLRALGWQVGYGMHVDGQLLWDGARDAWVNSRPPHDDPLLLEDHGLFCDPLEFTSSDAYRARHRRLPRALQWNLVAHRMDRAIHNLRRGGARS